MASMVDSKKEHILSAALESFADKGFSGTSMRAIAKAANVPLGLIYHYFENKEKLWVEVKLSGVQDYFKQDIFEFAPSDSLEEFIRYVVSNRFQFYANNPKVVRMILWQNLEVSGKPLSGFGKNQAKLKHWIRALDELKKKGKLRPDLDTELALFFIINSASAPYMSSPQPFGGDNKAQKEFQYQNMVIKTLHDGLSAENQR